MVAVLAKTDAAKYIGISERGLERLVERGKLRKVKINRRAVFRVVDLDRFLARHLAPAPTAGKRSKRNGST